MTTYLLGTLYQLKTMARITFEQSSGVVAVVVVDVVEGQITKYTKLQFHGENVTIRFQNHRLF